MNFQDLKKIESSDFYIDLAFRRASTQIELTKKKLKEHDKLKRSKLIEITRMDIIKNVLNEQLNKIIVAFPNIDDLNDFYRQLINCTLDYKDLKQSLGAIKWATKKVNDMFMIYKKKIEKTRDFKFINKLRREFYGRVSSILKQIKKNLRYIEDARKIMKDYPAIKTSLFTVCIFGFPNAGKSTLLKKLTNANPEIKAYAFTTKKLNLGYINTPKVTVQVIDTPGTLNRMDKMNYIELQAYLAIKHLANIAIYIFDPTLEYTLQEQEKLLKKLREYNVETLLYISKADIAPKDIVKQLRNKYKFINLDKLKELLLKKALA